VNHDAVGKPATADQAKDAVPGPPARNAIAAALDDARDLQSRNVGRATGGCGVVALTLLDVSRIEARVSCADDDVMASWFRVGPVL
jgi:hypothetical protein